MRRTPSPTPVALAALLSAALAAPGPAAEDPPAAGPWVLAPSDFALYERRLVMGTEGNAAARPRGVVTLHGSDLRDGGLFLPADPRREDLPAILAFRVLPAGTAAWRFDLAETARVHADATFRTEPAADGGQVVRAEWTFASRGKSDAPSILEAGRGTAKTTFDAQGVATESRVTLAYRVAPKGGRSGGEARAIEETCELRRTDLRRGRDERFAADVASAIERGVAFLRTQQKGTGTFEPHGNHVAGTTALGLYTLLACGVPRDDPQVAKGLAWLERQDLRATYDLATALLAMERAYVEPGNDASAKKAGADMPRERRRWTEECAKRLETSALAPGSWGYPNPDSDRYRSDTSNTQFAVLGLRSAARLGIAVRDETWEGVARHFALCRDKEAPRAKVRLGSESGARAGNPESEHEARAAAGFRYRPSEPNSHGAMTTAAIACLAVARDELRRSRTAKFPPREAALYEEMITGAWAWIDARYAVDRHPGHEANEWVHFWLWSLERAGVLSDVRTVGGRDWYFDGATELISRQQSRGAWDEGGAPATTETCFALLFLRRATVPAAAITPR